MQAINDQYTAGLVGSSELREAIGMFRGALRGKTGADRLAAGLQLQSDLRRKGGGYIDALAKVEALRSDPDYVNRFAVGARDCCPPGPNTSPMCTADGRRICDYDRVGDRDPGIAGNAVFTLTPNPAAGFAWWRPKMVRMFAHDTVNPSIPRWEGLFITLITIGAHPVEGFATPPAAAVTDGVHFGDFVVPDNTGVPVGWPDFSNVANAKNLVISGIGLWAAGVTFSSYVTVLGNPLDPNGAECRCNGDSSPVPPVNGNGAFTTGLGGRRF